MTIGPTEAYMLGSHLTWEAKHLKERTSEDNPVAELMERAAKALRVGDAIEVERFEPSRTIPVVSARSVGQRDYVPLWPSSRGEL